MTPASLRLFQQQRVAAVEQRGYFQRAAHHEAGHCVVGWHLGLGVERLWVGLPNCGPWASGCCRFTRAPFEVLELKDELIVSAAGAAADRRLCGRDDTGHRDLVEAIGPVLRAYGNAPAAAGEVLAAAARQADVLIQRYWRQVCELARALADAGTMRAGTDAIAANADPE